MFRKIGPLLVVLILLILLMVPNRAVAQSTANLQADIYQLRTQVNQLQAQVSRLSGQNLSQPVNPDSFPRINSRSPELSDRQLLDRLATLAIEAKDRMNALEERVSKLEKSQQLR